MSTPETARQSARAALRAAIECHQANNSEGAETKAHEAIAAWPEFPDAHHFRGILAIRRGAADFRAWLARRFTTAWAMFCAQRGAFDEAAAYGRALELDPDNRDSLRALVWIHRLAKRYDDAGLQERLVALEPDAVEAAEAFALILQDQGRSEEVVEGLRAVIARDADRPAAHLGLGFALEASKSSLPIISTVTGRSTSRSTARPVRAPRQPTGRSGWVCLSLRLRVSAMSVGSGSACSASWAWTSWPPTVWKVMSRPPPHWSAIRCGWRSCATTCANGLAPRP